MFEFQAQRIRSIYHFNATIISCKFKGDHYIMKLTSNYYLEPMVFPTKIKGVLGSDLSYNIRVKPNQFFWSISSTINICQKPITVTQIYEKLWYNPPNNVIFLFSSKFRMKRLTQIIIKKNIP